MRKQAVRNYPQFTHFASIPFIRQAQRKQLANLQQRITVHFANHQLQKVLNPNNPFLFHITLSMLTIPHAQSQQKVVNVIQAKLKKQIQQVLSKTVIPLQNIKYFTRMNKKINRNEVNIIYLDISDEQVKLKINKAIDLFIKALIKQQIIVQQQLKSMHICYDHKIGMFKSNGLHLTLFRVEGMLEDQKFVKLFDQIKQFEKQSKFAFDCDFFDISTRFNYDETRFYKPLHRVCLQGLQ